MGLDIYNYLVVGIRVKYMDFFKTTGVKKICDEKHINNEKSNFCSQCGNKLKEYKVKEPTNNFIEYIKNTYKEPDATASKVWEELKTLDGHPSIFNINSIQTDGDKLPPIAIGIKIGEVKGNQTANPISLPLYKIKEEANKVMEMAKKMGIHNDTIEIFTCSYITY